MLPLHVPFVDACTIDVHAAQAVTDVEIRIEYAWVREHSCPACGFTADRDANAAWNILSRGVKQVGVGHSESTPVETALPADTSVSAKRVVEAGSPTLKREPSGER
jgi:transposase